MNYIIHPGELDVRKGGPSGYIANLANGLALLNCEDKVDVISNKNQSINNVPTGKGKKVLKTLLGQSNIILEKYYEAKILKNNNLISIKDQLDKISFNSRDIIHIHNVLDYHSLNRNNNISGKIILTPHTPESISDEYINGIKLEFKNPRLSLNSLRRKLKKLEENAFRECEYFIFPSKEAMEIYSGFVSNFKEIMKNKKIYYNLTGCNRLSYKLNRNEFRMKYNIPEDSFLISFVGRHNKIKGFDILKQVALEIGKIDNKIHFISGGNGDIKSEGNNFTEIGWTDDPGSIINASDLFVLPNRNTYFDLVLLEVLSIGTPVLASETGGNKSIGKMTEGIRLFESGNIKEIVENIMFLKGNIQTLSSMRESNIKCYNENFTLQKFSERYLKILSEIDSL